MHKTSKKSYLKDFYLSLVNAGGAVQPQVNVPVMVKENLKDIQHPCHLGKNKNTMFSRLQVPQKVIQRLQFSYKHCISLAII